jgi:hypothetical protein
MNQLLIQAGINRALDKQIRFELSLSEIKKPSVQSSVDTSFASQLARAIST